MKNVLIAVIGNTGNEPEAARQALEVFGYTVLTKYIGRPNDLVDVLAGHLPLDPDFIILSCHGEDGEIIMPELDGSVYAKNEPRGNFSAAHVRDHLSLSGKVILNLGCTTGRGALADALSAANIYIAPTDYVDGRSALFFAIRLFYEIAKNDRCVHEAYGIARATDTETGLFTLKSPGLPASARGT